MADTRRVATLHFYQGAHGPTLMFQMYDGSQIEGLRRYFNGCRKATQRKLV
jgi:hypothetical protein